MNEEERYFREIREIEDRYFSLLSHFPANFPIAINLQIEKRKFFSALVDDKVYNPQLKFTKKKYDDKKLEELKNFKIDTKNDIYNIKKFYKDALKNKVYEVLCHKNWGKPISTKYVKKYRGKPSWFLLQKAINYCKQYEKQKVKFKILTPQVTAQRLKEEVEKLTGEKLKIVYSPNLQSKICIEPTSLILRINPKERFTSLDLKRFKTHEIGVHYMRYHNAIKTGIGLLMIGTANYIETEEGLAAYCEEMNGVASKAQMYIYAGRVIATYYAIKKSFYEVFQILKKYGFSDDVAFAITLRSKRNLSDTSKKGGFTKDYVYFSGYHKIKKYARKHDLKDLFIGKIKISDLKLLGKFIKRYKKN